MASALEKKFVKNSTIRKIGGVWECECKKGLWSVITSTKKSAKDEGRRYFVQYNEDGEYD